MIIIFRHYSCLQNNAIYEFKSNFRLSIPLVSSSGFFNPGFILTSEFVLFEPETTLMLLFVLLILPDGCLSNGVFFPVLGFVGRSLFGLFPPTFSTVVFKGGDVTVSESKFAYCMIKKKLDGLTYCNLLVFVPKLSFFPFKLTSF